MFSTDLYHEIKPSPVTVLLRQTFQEWYVINPIRKDDILFDEQKPLLLRYN